MAFDADGNWIIEDTPPDVYTMTGGTGNNWWDTPEVNLGNSTYNMDGSGNTASPEWWLDGFQGGDGSGYENFDWNKFAGVGGDSDGNGYGDAGGNDGVQPGDMGSVWGGLGVSLPGVNISGSGAGGTSGKSFLDSLLKGVTNADGSTNWGSLLPSLLTGGAGLAGAISSIKSPDTAGFDSSMKNANDLQTSMMGRLRGSYWPVEDKALAYAGRDPTVEGEQQAGDINAAYQQKAQQAREAQLREMASMGISPNNASYAATQQQADTLGAAANAAGMNAARQNAKQQVFQDQLNVSKLGAQYPQMITGLGDTAMRAATGKANAEATHSAGLMAGLGMLAQSAKGLSGSGYDASTVNKGLPLVKSPLSITQQDKSGMIVN